MSDRGRDEGFIRYPHRLDTAMACADFTKGARIVLREVLSQVLGPANSKTAKVSPTEMGKLCGMPKSFFGRAIRELVDSSVLEKLGECEYRFVEDYGRWTHKGQPRLSDEERALADGATGRAMSYKQSSGSNSGNSHKPHQETLSFGQERKPGGNPVNAVINPDNGVVNNPDNAHQSPLISVSNLDNGLLSKLPTDVINPDNGAHYIDRARLKTEDIQDESRDERAAPKKPCPPFPEEDGPLMVMPNAHPMDEKDARDIWRKMWAGWRDERLCGQFYEHQQWYAADVWRMAISQIKTSGATPRSIGYFEQRCADIEANGVKRPPTGSPRSVAAAVTSTPARDRNHVRRMTPEQKKALLDSVSDIEE